MPLYIGLSRCPHQVAPGFLQENKTEATMSPMTQLQRSRSVISMISFRSYPSDPFGVGGDYTGHNYQETRLSGHHLRGCPPQ